MILLRTIAVVVLTLVWCGSVPPLYAQSYKEIRLHSCGRADSTLPQGSDALKARVRALYNRSTDSTRLTAGNAATVTAKMTGHGPAPVAVAQLTVFLNNVEAELARRGEQPPIVTLTTDDSVTQELSPILFGTFVARGGTPPPGIIRIPLSAELDAVNLMAIARAREVVLHVGAVTIEISGDDRRDIAGLFVAMVCGM